MGAGAQLGVCTPLGMRVHAFVAKHQEASTAPPDRGWSLNTVLEGGRSGALATSVLRRDFGRRPRGRHPFEEARFREGQGSSWRRAQERHWAQVGDSVGQVDRDPVSQRQGRARLGLGDGLLSQMNSDPLGQGRMLHRWAPLIGLGTLC